MGRCIGYAPDQLLRDGYEGKDLTHPSQLGLNGRALWDAGCREFAYSVRASVRQLRPGSTLVAVQPLHLALTVASLRNTRRVVESLGATLKVLTADGRLNPTWDQCEAEIRRYCVEQAKKRGCYAGNNGRPKKGNAHKIRKLKGEGLSPEAIAAQLRISRATVFRKLQSKAAA